MLAAAQAGGQTLASRIDSIVAASPLAGHAFLGIHAVDPASGQTLYERNADRFFVPASNTKLFTSALALYRLGPEYRFTTRLLATHAIDSRGRLEGDLVLAGGGDPTLSARQYPYRKDAPALDPLHSLDALAGQLIARGLRRVDGDIVGDDTAYVWQPYPDGWGQDDPVWEYGAPVSALSLGDNAFKVVVTPGEAAGSPANVELDPPGDTFRVVSRVETSGTGVRRAIHLDRAPGSRELRLWGTIPAGAAPWSELLAVDDPAWYAAWELRETLRSRGVEVRGTVRARHALPESVADLEAGPGAPKFAGSELARLDSPPLLEILKVVDKVSQNLHAELVLRQVGLLRRGIGSRESGLKEMAAFLSEAGAGKDDFHFEDGSGLSRLGLVTPRAITTLLGYLYAGQYRDAFIGLLPIGGEDGTLAHRFAGWPEARRIHAKTGSLSHVAALSGYAERPGGEPAIVSILMNNYNGPDSEARKVVDAIAMAVAGARPRRVK